MRCLFIQIRLDHLKKKCSIKTFYIRLSYLFQVDLVNRITYYYNTDENKAFIFLNAFSCIASPYNIQCYYVCTDQWSKSQMFSDSIKLKWLLWWFCTIFNVSIQFFSAIKLIMCASLNRRHFLSFLCYCCCCCCCGCCQKKISRFLSNSFPNTTIFQI